jgi:hypothetical protein
LWWLWKSGSLVDKPAIAEFGAGFFDGSGVSAPGLTRSAKFNRFGDNLKKTYARQLNRV